MRHRLSILSSIFIFTILFATDHASAQKTTKYPVNIKAEDLIGKWKAAEVKTMNEFLGIPEPKAKPDAADTSIKVKGGQGKDSAAVLPHTQKMHNTIYHRQLRASIEFKADKTGTYFIGSTPIKLTWKLKKNIITAKDVKTKDKYRIEIIKFSGDELMVFEHTQLGDTYIAYKRIRE
jgi:hypothetical protein